MILGAARECLCGLLAMGAHKRRGIKDRFGYIPLDVLESEEYQTLNYAHRHLLTCIAAQYYGYNNGHLTFTRQDGLRFGFHSEDTRYKGLNKLEQLGLIFKTHQGGLDQLGANRWGLPWVDLNYSGGKELPVRRPAKGWPRKKQIQPTTPRSTSPPLSGGETPSTVTSPRGRNG